MALQDTLAAFSDAQPSGADPEYDADFQELERAARPGEERQAGAEIIAGEEPDYRDVAQRAEAILERCHDLRVAVYFILGATWQRGFPGLAEGTSYVRGVLETFWDSCHPELDHDDPDDMALFRVNTMRGLTDGATVLRAVRHAPLALSNAFGRVTLRDLEVADGEREAREGEEVLTDPAKISAAFQDTDAETLSGIAEAARRALADIRAIEAVFDAQVPGRGPDLAPLSKLLFKAVKRLDEATGGDPAEAAAGEDAASAGAPAQAAATAGAAGGPPGTITSQADVTKALDRILEYYRRHEPSSPLPVLLERAKRLVGADFVTIMKDMAPGGVDNVYLIGGIEVDEE